MEASVTDPDGSTELCEIMDEEDFHYRMMFTPQMEGTHTLSIKHKGLHISGTAAWHTVCIYDVTYTFEFHWIQLREFLKSTSTCNITAKNDSGAIFCLFVFYLHVWGQYLSMEYTCSPLWRKNNILFPLNYRQSICIFRRSAVVGRHSQSTGRRTWSGERRSWLQ